MCMPTARDLMCGELCNTAGNARELFLQPSKCAAAHDYFILHEPPWRVIGFCVHTPRPFFLCPLCVYFNVFVPLSAPKMREMLFEERAESAELLSGMLSMQPLL